MTQNELCFIHFLSCFLNSKVPTMVPDDWQRVFDLSDINGVAGIVAAKMLMLPKEMQPKGKLRSEFKQTLGLTICQDNEKRKSQLILEEFLEENSIDYIYVKGAAIRDLYPSSELRTSGDIDIIVRPTKFMEIIDIFNSSSFEVKITSAVVIVVNVGNLVVEVHSGADVLGNYFENDVFGRCKADDFKYSLDDYDQLLYIILHLAKHLKYRGAGIRMLMDIDVCIRGIENFDDDKIIKMCADAGVEKCAKALFSLSKLWFDTPISDFVDIENNPDLVNLLADNFLHGGTFGFCNNNLGDYYVARAAKGENVDITSKFKALLCMFFPSVETIKNRYVYVLKNPFLLPIGYINRFFDGVFKRGKHSVNTAKQIVASDDSILIKNQILSELEIL